jgi:hypothetical protein
MRQGMPPSEACRAAFERMCEKIPEARHTQEALIAINKKGEVGCATNTGGFTFYYGDGDQVERNHPDAHHLKSLEPVFAWTLATGGPLRGDRPWSLTNS